MLAKLTQTNKLKFETLPNVYNLKYQDKLHEDSKRFKNRRYILLISSTRVYGIDR